MSIRLPRCSNLAIMPDLAVMAVSGLLFFATYNVVRAIVGLLLVALWSWYLA